LANFFLRPGLEQAETSSVHRSTVLIAIAAVLAVLFAIVGAVYFVLRPTNLRIAVGPPGSDDVKVIQAIAQAIGRERGSIRLRTSVTESVVASAAALESGTADLAVVRGDLAMPKNAQAVAILRKNVVVLWASPAGTAKGKPRLPPIKKIGDLAGRKVGVIGRTEANVNVLKVILSQYGVAADKVQIEKFSTTEVAEAVRAQKAEAYFAVGPLNSPITTDAIAASSRGAAPVFLAIDASEAIAQRFPFYESMEIPAGAFGSAPAKPDDAIKTIGLSHYIVARKGLSESTVATFARTLFAVRQSIATEQPQASRIETPDTDKDAVVPAHPGAAAYVDGEEKSFFERYSDLIYILLIALSGVGSAAAWFASYLKKDERTNHNALRERLLDMLALARLASLVEELDALQMEADDILRRIIHAYSAEAIDDTTLTAFSIVLPQVHAAIADRRSALLADLSRGPRASIAVLAPPPASSQTGTA
jgi:TRAP transporter TAXI family solute receptor